MRTLHPVSVLHREVVRKVYQEKPVFISKMTQKISCGTLDTVGTELLIRQALASRDIRRIVLRPQFLDDEKLPEAERVHALREVFNRNIRLKQLERLANAMSPVVTGALPPNILIYGPTGTGKSVTCLHFLSSLATLCDAQDVPFRFYYLDFTTPKTCFGALNEMAIALDGSVRRYRKGIALEHIQETIIAALGEVKGSACVLIDEIDNITTDSDVFLTFLVKTLPKRVSAGLFYVFLTNRLAWERNLDPRILSVLKKQDMIFEPYDALDLIEILRIRVEKALDQRKVETAAIRKIAAFASHDTGDARKAVELLSKSVKVGEETSGRVTEHEVDLAEHSLEIDKTEELIGALAAQQRLALKGCYLGLSKERKRLSTGSAFGWYRQVCDAEGVRPLSQRHFSNALSHLDLYGLLNARAISKGRYGKTRELSSALPEQIVQKLLQR